MAGDGINNKVIGYNYLTNVSTYRLMRCCCCCCCLPGSSCSEPRWEYHVLAAAAVSASDKERYRCLGPSGRGWDRSGEVTGPRRSLLYCASCLTDDPGLRRALDDLVIKKDTEVDT